MGKNPGPGESSHRVFTELLAEKDAEIERLREMVKAKHWGMGVMADVAQHYEKHLKEILCASDEVPAEDLQAHAGLALDEATWDDDEIATARAVLSPKEAS